jgi:hypothetical protein
MELRHSLDRGARRQGKAIGRGQRFRQDSVKLRLVLTVQARLIFILESQGEAQKLRIMSVGAAAMDSKALAIMSMDTLKAVSDGQASKIYMPMEVTKLMDGISDYLGATRNVADREVSDVDSIKEAVGDPDDILGPIPTQEEIKEKNEAYEREAGKEIEEESEIPDDIKV